MLLAGLFVWAVPLASPAAASSSPTVVHWFVGLGAGTQPNQVTAEQDFVTNYNATNTDNVTIQVDFESNATAADTLKADIDAGNPPDIIGPVGVRGRVGLDSQFLDLTSEISKNSTDLTGYDPALVNFFKDGTRQIGLPYDIYPGYIWYNKDIFAKAGLPALPTKVGATYQGHTWDWNELATVAKQLTVDKNGKKSTDAGFDSSNIVQYGMDFQWADGRRMASTFGGGSFVAADGVTAQIPAAYSAAWNWYYAGIWTSHFIPNGAAEASTLLAQGNSQSSGNVAMNAGWAWSISSIASDAASAKVKNWDIAVLPTYAGQTSSPVDADTFTIAKASAHPDEAYKAMLAIEADTALMTTYGGEPAKKADQPAYFAAFDAQLAPIFPGNTVTWSVLQEMEKYPAVPSHEAAMPAYGQIVNDYGAFFTKLQLHSGLSINTEIAGLQGAIQADLDTLPTTFTVGTASTVVAGSAHGVVVTALDSHGNVATGYTGTIQFTSSDPDAVLPADYIFTATDNGVHTFSYALSPALVLKTAGTQSVTATDADSPGIHGSQTGIVVNPGVATHLAVTGMVTPRTAGSYGTVTVTAKDAYGNTAKSYTGTVHLTSTDGAAVLPANYTFTASDAGVHKFGVTLKTAGTKSVTATDTVTASIHGSQTGIVVN
jgi:multiple sugar transport system substrate-binding protein